MSEKRFTVESTMVIDCILDNKTGEQLDTFDYTERLCDFLNEQQSTISALKEENEQLRQQLKWKQEENVKSVKGEVFTFNTNCAKLYQIRSVSPNGVIRIGSKNYKVKWRMKDVREINNELPSREEFNREKYNKLRNKYHTKNWCGDNVLGRIIYNIYNGTFGDYL